VKPTVAEIEATVASGVTLVRCPKCRREEPIGDHVQRAVDGWPECCGGEMRLGVPAPARASVDPRDA
jgi:hypothetical protein